MKSSGDIRDWVAHVVGSKAILKALEGDVLDERSVFFVEHAGDRLLAKHYDDLDKARANILGSSFAQDVAGIRTPRIVASDSAAGFVIQEYIDGTSLGEMLKAGTPSGELAAIVREVGRVVRQLHDGRIDLSAALPILELRPALNDELQRLGKFGLYMKTEAASAEPLLDPNLLLELASGIESFPALSMRFDAMSVVHGDLWSDNVIVSPSGIALVDFEWASIADPLLDTARMYSRGLVWRDLSRPYQLHPPSHLWQSFQSGYREVIANREPTFRAAVVYGLVRTINHYCKRVRTKRDFSAASDELRTISRIAAAAMGYLDESDPYT
jgi:tRNA A-37 threonylcarbamoyl transferase component Bud32